MTDPSPPTILQRIKTYDRIETDIPDDEIQRIIDEANAEVVLRFGPHANPLLPITVRLDGGAPTLDLLRPMDVAYPATVTEFWRSAPLAQTQSRVLVVDVDYRVWFGGRTLERVASGTNYFDSYWSHNPSPQDRFGWGGSAGWVEITYVPVNDGNQREEVIIKLVRLSLDYDPATRVRMGNIDVFPLDYQTEREKILSSLMPRRGLMLR